MPTKSTLVFFFNRLSVWCGGREQKKKTNKQKTKTQAIGKKTVLTKEFRGSREHIQRPKRKEKEAKILMVAQMV